MPSRRRFLQDSLAAGVATSLVAATSPSSAAGANDRIHLALIGAGGRGKGLAREFAKLSNVRFTTIADTDAKRANSVAAEIKKIGGSDVAAVSDFRTVLDDKSVDAVVIATPDHWHGPAAILAADAGKHVYVEKPASHNVREGRLMIEAARRNKIVMQTGTQSRSSPPIVEAIQMLREGAIGKVLAAKAWNNQRRANIGHAQPSKPPTTLDYDLWVGPAEYLPYQSNRLHYHWHWWYNFGTGDTGNDGVHEMDIARWGLGVDEHPSYVAAVGGKYHFDDDQQFPDTITATFEWPGGLGERKQLTFEQRIWAPYRLEGYENGNAFFGTEGMLLLGKNNGWKLFGPRNKLVRESAPSGMGIPHYQNFVDCIRNDGRPNADIEIGHRSACLSHLANIAVRAGRSFQFDPAKEEILGAPDIAHMTRRAYRAGHWAIPKGV